jgi:hypothetical protein
VFGARGEGVLPSDEILLDSLSLGALDVALHARPPKGALGGSEPIFPSDDGALLVVQLLLPMTSYSCSSSTTADITTTPGGGEGLHTPTSND